MVDSYDTHATHGHAGGYMLDQLSCCGDGRQITIYTVNVFLQCHNFIAYEGVATDDTEINRK